MKKRKKSYKISKIDIEIGELKGFSHPQYVISIDDVSLNDYLNIQTSSNDFDLLLPPVGMISDSDQQKMLGFLQRMNSILPVLMCSDDMDFSCIVVSAYAVDEGDVIVWQSFGYGLDMRENIAASSLAFDKNCYAEFVNKFKSFIRKENADQGM